jgi:hypothetical protein
MEHRQPFDDPDLDNPYAPPKSTAPREQTLSDFSGLNFTASDIFNWSWAIYKDNMGICMALVLGSFLLNLGINFGTGLILGAVGAAIGDPRIVLTFNFLAQFVGMIIQAWLGIGMTLGLLKVARRQPVSFDILFTGGRYLLTVILGGILIGAIFFAALIVPIIAIVAVFASMRGEPSPAALGVVLVAGLLCAVLILYLSARLTQFFYLIIDRNAGVMDSIRLSWQLTQKRAGTIILIYFLQAAINLAGILAVCVGLIFAIPLSTLLLVVTYLALTGKVKAAERTPYSNLGTWDEEL